MLIQWSNIVIVITIIFVSTGISTISHVGEVLFAPSLTGLRLRLRANRVQPDDYLLLRDDYLLLLATVAVGSPLLVQFVKGLQVGGSRHSCEAQQSNTACEVGESNTRQNHLQPHNRLELTPAPPVEDQGGCIVSPKLPFQPTSKIFLHSCLNMFRSFDLILVLILLFRAYCFRSSYS